MTGMPGLVEMRSLNKSGLSIITLVFTDTTDVYFARQLVTERLKERSEEHTSELQSPCNLVCRLLLEKKKKINPDTGILDVVADRHPVLISGEVYTQRLLSQ